MNKQTKYYFILKTTVIVLLLNILIGFILRTLPKFDFDTTYLSILEDFLRVVRGFFITYIIAASGLFLYLLTLYLMSSFYKQYKINPIEAVYYGVIDMHVIFEKLVNSNRVDKIAIDFKRQIIYLETKGSYFSIIYQDLFGVFNGKEDSEYWTKLSKKAKEYNKVIYRKREKFPNPYKVNEDFATHLKETKGHTYKTITVLSGLYKMQYKPSTILAPYEINDIFKK